tara:strand:+ start:828 stop:1325 length:498 start_codon:yes stop_codon:yes gene_type:complete
MTGSIHDLTRRAWEFLAEHPGPWLASSVASIVMFVVSILLVPLVIRRLPVDHFIAKERPPRSWQRILWVNLGGWLLIVAGLFMLVLPGQGLLSILLGLQCVDLPGKRRLELALLRRPAIRRAVDWIRTRKGHVGFRYEGEIATGEDDAPVGPSSMVSRVAEPPKS